MLELQKFCDSIGPWSRAQFEDELIQDALELVEDYVDALNGEGCMITKVIRRSLKSENKSPIRNAYLIHELHEARTFAERGFDYSRTHLGSDKEYDWQQFAPLRAAFLADKDVHLKATVKHCSYLREVAAERRYLLGLGDLVRADFMSSPDDQDRILAETDLCHDPGNDAAIVEFLSPLFADVPAYFGFQKEVMTTKGYFMRLHAASIQEYIESSRI